MCNLLHHNQVGMYGNIIYFLICFVRIPTRNSVNPISKTTIPRLVKSTFLKVTATDHVPKKGQKHTK